MSTTLRRHAPLALAVGAALMFSACSAPAAAPNQPAAATIQVTDNRGTVAVPSPPQRVIATDNRLFQTLAEWNVKLVAAPVAIIEADSPYKKDPSVVDLGFHTEPNLEALVATNPDLVINGQRFSTQYDAIKKLAPQAAMLDLNVREDQPFDAELKRQVQALGPVFGKKAEADKLVADFDAAVARVKAAYKPGSKVMTVITSGGKINYAAPKTGRTLGPVYDILGLTPALTAEGTEDHEGAEISVEAIAASNPEWILVMDRDAALAASVKDYKPANELLANSAALKNVDAVKQKRIIYMPANTYLNEGLQTYTTFFNSIADAMESS